MDITGKVLRRIRSRPAAWRHHDAVTPVSSRMRSPSILGPPLLPRASETVGSRNSQGYARAQRHSMGLNRLRDDFVNAELRRRAAESSLLNRGHRDG